MKTFKNIIVSSDGSLNVCYVSEVVVASNKFVVFNKLDHNNFTFNQKKVKNTVDVKNFSSYKKKYFKTD